MNGWKRRKRRADRRRAGVVAASALTLLGTLAVAGASAPERPDEELLLFLADWADADGRWWDPFGYARAEPVETDSLQVIDDEQTISP